MKTFRKKLVLNKKTVANIDTGRMTEARGGGITDPFTVCGQECSVQMCTGITCGPCAYTVVGCETAQCPPLT